MSRLVEITADIGVLVAVVLGFSLAFALDAGAWHYVIGFASSLAAVSLVVTLLHRHEAAERAEYDYVIAVQRHAEHEAYLLARQRRMSSYYPEQSYLHQAETMRSSQPNYLEYDRG